MPLNILSKMDFKAEKSVQLRISLNYSVFTVMLRKYEKEIAKMFL